MMNLPSKIIIIELQAGALFETAELVNAITSMGIQVIVQQGAIICSRIPCGNSLEARSIRRTTEVMIWLPDGFTVRARADQCDERRLHLNNPATTTLITQRPESLMYHGENHALMQELSSVSCEPKAMTCYVEDIEDHIDFADVHSISDDEEAFADEAEQMSGS